MTGAGAVRWPFRREAELRAKSYGRERAEIVRDCRLASHPKLGRSCTRSPWPRDPA